MVKNIALFLQCKTALEMINRQVGQTYKYQTLI